MHSRFINNQQIEEEQGHVNVKSIFTETDALVTPASSSASEPTRFYSQFQDCMEMYAPAEKVTAYLDAHQNWFSRCAHPMKVEPIGANGYALVIGRFGSFGYEVEPKVGLELLPQDSGIYRIRTIPVPNYVAPGYDVDFQASQAFVEVPTSEYLQEQECDGVKLPEAITRVEWNLDLSVALRFPKFIHRLPQSLIQSTGDRLLQQIVRQVSRRLTHKVQEDFHSSMGIPMPKKIKKH
ncbi:MAG TPA: hypothetical protein DCE56_15305 [Cyanobacteria bacterium UBA8553]|nr:hypothetical protein [Cyanobacteria bacterium UBA8553]HAJ64654.1 hypothetical protein [Cyanobacteria bacterium UBA8543]